MSKKIAWNLAEYEKCVNETTPWEREQVDFETREKMKKSMREIFGENYQMTDTYALLQIVINPCAYPIFSKCKSAEEMKELMISHTKEDAEEAGVFSQYEIQKLIGQVINADWNTIYNNWEKISKLRPIIPYEM